MISLKDRRILRDTAKLQREYASLPKMAKLKEEWTLHNTLRGKRPMISVEIGTFFGDVISPFLNCEGEQARSIESALYFNMLNHILFDDDTPVQDYFPISYQPYFKPFNIDEQVVRLENSLGHHFVEQIKDFKTDCHLLQKSAYGIDKKVHISYMNLVDDLFGDILPVKLIGSSLVSCMTQNFVHIMSMETMFMAMFDAPEEFKAAMNQLSDDYISYFKLLESEGVLLPTARGEHLNQGSFCYTDELPNCGSITTKDVWGYLDSQETVGISPDMFAEFIFPYYQKVASCFGLLSYGCCEPVDSIWKPCLSKLENLRKLSISPWCNEEYMGEQLQGKPVIYLRKPSPNYLGVEKELDEDALRTHIQKTVKAARGCHLEFAQRDVYTIHHNPKKVKRYVEILREETESTY